MNKEDLGVKEWEDQILLPLKIMKWFLIGYIVLILVVPVYKGSGLFIDSLFSVFSMVVLILGYLSRCGRVANFNAMFTIALVRGIQLLVDLFIFKDTSLNFLVWVFMILVEFGLAFFYLIDASRFECVKELEEK